MSFDILSDKIGSVPIVKPTVFQSFSDYVSQLKLKTKYSFGSAASGIADSPSGYGAVIPIRNATDLALSFNPLTDFGGDQVTNSSLHRFQPFSSSGNFVFGGDHLSLIATLDPGGHVTPTVVTQAPAVSLDGTATTIANLGVASTAGLQVGQMCCVLFKGLYYISAMVLNTSVTLTQLLGSPTSAPGSSLVVFFPYYVAIITTTNTGVTFTCSAGVPAGVTVGMFLGGVGSSNIGSGGNGKQTVVVTAVTATTFTIDTIQTFANGAMVAFMPPIRSAQLWSKTKFQAGSGDVVFASELVCQLPHNTTTPGAEQAAGAFTATAYNALPTDAPMGAWPSRWYYSGNDMLNGGLGSWRDNSEPDNPEFFNNLSLDMRVWTGFTHGTYPATSFVDDTTTNQGGSNSTYKWFSINQNLAVRRFQDVFTNDALYRYVDGVLYRAETWRWGSKCPMQVAFDMGVGSLIPAYAASIFAPNNNANFPMSFDIYSYSIWGL